MKVLAIAGSLRKGSYNMLALRAAQKVAPKDMEISIADISDIPFYNEDVFVQGLPASVQALRKQAAEADGILIACPEYNFSVPGVLKNTLDWLSRPPAPPFDGKPLAILGASPGPLGTGRAQYHLRQILVFMNTSTVNKPEVFIGGAPGKFSESGELTDELASKLIGDLLAALKNSWRRTR